MGLIEDILKTKEYAAKFDCELTDEEIKERLISNRVYTDKEVDKMIETHRLCETPPLKREALTEEKIKKVNKIVKIIEKEFKDILYIGITGSVAAGHPNKNSDIDLMVITKRNKLWWTRLKMRWFIYKKQIPHRKYGQKENENEFCFNFWLDENNLKLPKDRQNLRCAVDLILMKPILDKKNTYAKFILSNDWAKQWVATGYDKKIKLFAFRQDQKISFKKDDVFWKLFNWLVFVPQYLFMKDKIKSEKVGLGFALFNERRKIIDKAV